MSKLYASTVINVAKGEIGYKEKASNSNLDNKTANAGSANYTKYARDFDEKYPNWYNGKKNGFAWCDMFVDWCFLTAFGYANALSLLCQPEKSAGAGCTYSYSYYKKKGQTGKSPKIGAQIFFGASESNLTHTGLVYNYDSAKVYTIEGNTSDQVAYREYAIGSSKIYGYGYPAYDAETTTSQTVANTSGGKASTTAEPKTIWNYLLGKIGNAYGVAGLMGNLYAESALNPSNLQNSFESKLGYSDTTYTAAVDNGSYTNFVKDSAGYGLAQWTYYTRKQALLTYCQSKKASVGNLTAQLEFLYKELSESYKTTLNALKNATSVKAASDAVLTQFERPADQSDAVKTKRASYGKTYYDKYASGKTETTTQTTTSTTTTKVYKIESATSKESGHGKGKKFKVTTGLNFRTGAGINKTKIRVLAQGESVTWYGYYTTVSGVKWYLVVDKNGQTGFVSSQYLA